MNRDYLTFFAVLPRADLALAVAWWVVLLLRGILPALLAVVTGSLVGAVQRGESLAVPLAELAAVFIPLQILAPLHLAIGANLGSRMAAWLYDRLAFACIRPAGMGHLEDPKLTSDLSMARDFDLGITAPPMFISMEFIASGMVEMVAGLASSAVLFWYAWWAPPLLAGAWVATHWLMRDSAIWRERNTPEVREAQRQADYAYRLAVEPPASKEMRLFGLADWTVERFAASRRKLFELRWAATRLRQQPIVSSLILVSAASLIVFGSLANSAANGSLPLDRVITFATAAITTSLIAFGGVSWAIDSASAPVTAVLRLEKAMTSLGTLSAGSRPAKAMPAREIRFRDVTFAYPGAEEPVLDRFDLVIPAGTSLAIVGQNGAGKTTLAKLICRLYDPQSGSIEIDGVDLRELDIEAWRSRLTAVFQDFIRFELPLRQNVAPKGAADDIIQTALANAGASTLTDLSTILARGYEGGTELSGGQWQRVALARALCAVGQGAGVVLLDEPTAQLDVRGESEIFERILTATRETTTILISHRFSTVRHADRICVLEHGAVVELGSHDELMALNGRYRTMFDLQASRFESDEPEEEGVEYESLS
jgi:ABC-type multidrug transport system fused ATPase/permease subunit